MADRIQFQEKLTDAPERFDIARDYEVKLQALGRALISGLYMLLRNVKLYSPDNQIFTKPLEQLMDVINTIIAMDSGLNLQGAGEAFYLNNMLIKLEITSLDNVRYIQQEFERRNIGGFVLKTSITIPELVNFIYIFSKESGENVDEQGVAARKLEALKLRRWEKVQEILKEQQSIAEGEQIDRKRYTLTVYARTLYFMRKYFLGLRGEGPKIPVNKAGRYIQDLVDISFKHQNHFLGATTLKSDDEYLCFHSVNVALLAIVFGSELGLSKSQLRELGMAALFHDIGMVDVAEELLQRRGKLKPEELREVRRSPIYSVRKILCSRPLNRMTIHRLIAAFEHKSDFGRLVHDLRGNISFIVPQSDLSAFSKIISIAECYDALTSRRPYREAFAPEIALTLMWTELRQKFDPEYLKVFMNVMKVPLLRVLSEKGERIVLF